MAPDLQYFHSKQLLKGPEMTGSPPHLTNYNRAPITSLIVLSILFVLQAFAGPTSIEKSTRPSPLPQLSVPNEAKHSRSMALPVNEFQDLSFVKIYLLKNTELFIPKLFLSYDPNPHISLGALLHFLDSLTRFIKQQQAYFGTQWNHAPMARRTQYVFKPPGPRFEHMTQSELDQIEYFSTHLRFMMDTIMSERINHLPAESKISMTPVEPATAISFSHILGHDFGHITIEIFETFALQMPILILGNITELSCKNIFSGSYLPVPKNSHNLKDPLYIGYFFNQVRSIRKLTEKLDETLHLFKTIK